MSEASILYKNRKIQLVPVGASEWDVVIDDLLRIAGTDDYEVSVGIGKRYIDDEEAGKDPLAWRRNQGVKVVES
jgi:hypothetical protein